MERAAESAQRATKAHLDRKVRAVIPIHQKIAKDTVEILLGKVTMSVFDRGACRVRAQTWVSPAAWRRRRRIGKTV